MRRLSQDREECFVDLAQAPHCQAGPGNGGNSRMRHTSEAPTGELRLEELAQRFDG